MMKIPFVRVDCSGNELEYISQVIDSGWLTTAGRTSELEKRFGDLVEGKFSCAVNSATAALHLGLDALGVGESDKVLVQSMTFTSSAEIARYLCADPVFLDSDPNTRLLTPSIVQEAINRHPEAKVLVVVHFGGQAAQMMDFEDGPGILSICKKHGLKILEDAAHAFPTRHAGKMVGSFGDATCFSFYANKTITTGEGGMLTTNDPVIAKRVRIMRLHGINRDVWDRFTDSKANWEYDVVAPGFKYNMADVNAAIGLAQLERAFEMRDARQKVAEFYLDNLADVECIELPKIIVPFKDHAWHLFCIIIKPEAPLSRNEFIEKMAEAGIGTSVHYKPLHRMTYYRERYNLKPEDFPNTERIWKGTVSLPIYPSLTEEELEYIVSKIRSLLC